VVAVTKKPRSFSIDEDVAEILAQREDVNASAAVNQFLRQYVASGDGEEAALRVRLEQLDDEIASLEKELEQKRRERDRIEGRLQDQREEQNEVLLEVEKKIKSGVFPAENINPSNPAIQNWANEAGITAELFCDKLESRL
jgi:septal ring factor EnvC (AmiA/AmiB activator)